jgi:hypothetical protein
VHRLLLNCADRVWWVQGLLMGLWWVIHQGAGVIGTPGVGCCRAACGQHANSTAARALALRSAHGRVEAF